MSRQEHRILPPDSHTLPRPEFFGACDKYGRPAGSRELDPDASMQLELVAAAVERCRAIESQLGERDAQAVDSSRTALEGSRFEEVVAREPILRPYLEACGSEPRLALALAQGDVAWFRSLQERAWSEPPSAWQWLFDFAAGVMKAPALVVVLAAVAGTLAGASHLQRVALRQEKQFASQIERLNEAQRAAATVRADLDLLLWQVMSKDYTEQGGPVPVLGIEDLLHRFRRKLIQIDTVTRVFTPDEELSQRVRGAVETLNTFKKCMDEQAKSGGASSCAKTFDTDTFDAVIDQLGVLRLKLLTADET